MTCDYCFYCDEAAKRARPSYGAMSDETLQNVIRKTMEEADGVASYTWQGGEPTLRGLSFYQAAIRYQKQYNRNNARILNAFQTNGYDLSDAWCRFFKENEILVGLSADGTAQLHDALRHDRQGGPTFCRVEETAKRLDAYAVPYNILTVVTPQTAARVREIYESNRRRGWLYQQYIACLEPYGEGHGKKPYALSPAQYGRFLSDLFALWCADLREGRQPYIRQFENYVGLAAGYMAESCEQRGVCGVQYVVEADGGVYPCDFYVMDEFYLGDLNTDSIGQIDERRRRLGFIERSALPDKKCGSCRYFRLCRGGCMRQRDWQEDEGVYRNYFCEGYRLFFDRWYETIMALGTMVRK